MSEPNAEIVRRALHTRRSEFAELFDPAVRLDLSERVFNPAVYDGYDGILQWRAEVGEIWESYRTTPEELFESGQAVVVFAHERGRGRLSGVEIDRLTALLCRLRDRPVIEIRLYHDRQQALCDAGLEQSSASA